MAGGGVGASEEVGVRTERTIRGRDAAPAPIGDVPGGLPPLVRAHRIQQKVASIGFDWADAAGAREKVAEELAEADEAAGGGDAAALEEEFGDLLFAIVNWGRLLGLHPDLALRGANRKFEQRFRRLEALASERGVDLEASSLEALDALWESVKASEASGEA